METLYEVPLAMEKENLAQTVCKCLHLDCPEPDIKGWEDMVNSIKNLNKEVTVALVGKYTALHDAYISVVESLKHGGFAHNAQVNIKWVNSEDVTPENVADILGDVSGVLIPGGFGDQVLMVKYMLSSMPAKITFHSLVSASVCSYPS